MRILTTLVLILVFVAWLPVRLSIPSKAATIAVSNGKADANASATAVPVKRALLVGINKYNRGSKEPDHDWWDLHTKYDIENLKDVLLNNFKFDEVRVLDETKGETTHQGIIEAFRQYLIKPSQKGDIIYFHYSGHGQQIPDDNNDEIDGYDESLIPSDYVSQKDGSKNIRDDEIGVLLDELKAREPANMTVTLDSCFSGTATRGEVLPPRGGPWKGPKVAADKIRGEETSPSGLVTRGGQTPSESYVFISAASPRQTAKEFYSDDDDNKAFGLFTYSLVKALKESGSTTTYRDLFERINDTMTRRRRDQNPQLEGRMDQVVLKEGSLRPPQPYIGVTVEGQGNVILQAGSIQGMTKGSRFAIYPAGTKERKDGAELAKAEIEKLDVTTAVLKVEGRVEPEKLEAARAFETMHNYDSVLKVAVEDIASFNSGAETLRSIKSADLVENIPQNKKNWNVLIRKPFPDGDEKGFRGVILQRPDGSIIAKVQEGNNMSQGVQAALAKEARWVTVKSLNETVDQSLKVEMRLIPVNVELSEDGKYVKRVLGDKQGGTTLTEGGHGELRVGDHVMVELRNTGVDDAYVSILDLRSDSRIGPIFPHPRVPRDNFLKAGGDWIRLQFPYVFEITEPLGEESFRAIATREKTDFSPLIDPDLQRGKELDERGRNASNSPLGKILRKAREGKRADLGDVPPTWTTTTVTFFVRPKS